MSLLSPSRAHNFSAGPAALPLSVLEELRGELPTYGTLGSTLFEISHRSKPYAEMHGRAVERLKRLLGMDDSWNVLFLQGGATLQFHMVPLNFLPEDSSADYLNTGVWATKAITEARRIGRVNVAASGEASAFARLPDPKDWYLDIGAEYLHYTSNNTIYGTQFKEAPKADVPLVCDASSDFLSRPIDLSAHGLIYAGAQKNLGPAGVTVVLVHDEFLLRSKDGLPPILDYKAHSGPLLNTPPAMAVYLVEKVLAWLEGQGGVEGIQAINARKAAMLYACIDAHPAMYTGYAAREDRSAMNVLFHLPTPELEARFLEGAALHNMVGLKGYRSTGGIRASLYNAVSEASVQVLTDFMRDFAASHG